MKDSPFIYGTTVSEKSFTNREAETLKLQSNLVNGINTMLISPRRWGKSSLVEKVIANINKKDKKTKTVIIDLFSVSSETEFLELFAREVIKASSNKWQDWTASGGQFFKKLIPKFTLGIDPNTDFNLSFDWKDLSTNSAEIIDLPEIIAKQKNIRFIICLDEFQNLAHFANYEVFEKKLRACWQRHKLVTYCLYGSKRHMMTDIFNNPSKPFYRFGDIMLLNKITTEKWVKFICESFEQSGKKISPKIAEKIPNAMKNHSWYVQQLAHYTWNISQKTATISDVENALNELVRANTPLYQKEVETISATQLNLLKAIAKNETQFTSVAVMQTHQLGTPNNVIKNKAVLISNDSIHEVNNQFEFLDPAFELWFKKQYFNQSYNNQI